MLANLPMKALGDRHIKARHITRECLKACAGPFKPLGLDVGRPMEPEGTSHDRYQPDGNCGPHVGPRVTLIVAMPEHEPHVYDSHDNVEVIEGLVEAMADPWNGESDYAG